ncbi:MAG: tetratricopeptide repeat protein [Candidatus Sumerlaeia bacterium]|nr:tetratricopeptide repeat protein [Candidatus Sumerlaeia bacterium]
MSKAKKREKKEKRGGVRPPARREAFSLRRFFPADPAPLLYGTVIALAIVLAYANSFAGTFVFDDTPSITGNPTIRQLWRLDRVLSPPRAGEAVQNRPVVNLTLAVNWALGGSRVFGYHLFNLVIHLVSALALFGIVRRTLLLPKFGGRFRESAIGYAAAAALLWGVHPLNTEAVTYIVQRTESLFSMFYLLTLYCCIRGLVSSRSRLWFSAAIAACALGMGSKEAMVTAPLMVLLYDRVFAASSWREIYQHRRGLYIGLAATWILLGAILVLASGARGGAAGFGFGMTWWEYARTQLWAVCRYLRLAFWPVGLVVDYGTWTARTPGEIVPYALVVVALMAATVAAWFRWPWAGYLGTWFFVILAPSSSIVPLLTQTIAEKRMYLPLTAVVTLAVIIAGEGTRRFLERRIADEAVRRGSARWLSVGAVACLAVILGAMTHARNRDYRSEIALWDDVIRKRPDNPRAYLNRAYACQKIKAWDQAIADCDKAVELAPNDPYVYLKRGEAYAARGDTSRALADFDKAIELDPTYARPYLNRGNILRDRGDLHQAIEQYSKAIELMPDLTDAYNNRGLLHARLGNLAQAVDDFTKAIAVNPLIASYYANRASVWNLQGRYPQAIADCNRAIELDPDAGDVYLTRGNAYGQLGNAEQAMADYSKAVELKPNLAEAYNNRGGLHIQRGAYDRALEDLDKAIALRPEYANAYCNRALAYYYLEDYAKARADVARAKDLGTTPPARLLERLAKAPANRTTP